MANPLISGKTVEGSQGTGAGIANGKPYKKYIERWTSVTESQITILSLTTYEVDSSVYTTSAEALQYTGEFQVNGTEFVDGYVIESQKVNKSTDKDSYSFFKIYKHDTPVYVTNDELEVTSSYKKSDSGISGSFFKGKWHVYKLAKDDDTGGFSQASIDDTIYWGEDWTSAKTALLSEGFNESLLIPKLSSYDSAGLPLLYQVATVFGFSSDPESQIVSPDGTINYNYYKQQIYGDEPVAFDGDFTDMTAETYQENNQSFSDNIYQSNLALWSVQEYQSVDWSAVDSSLFTDQTYSSINWSLVPFSDLSSNSKKTLDWSKLKVGGDDGLVQETLSTTDLLQISLGTDISSVNFRKTDWNSVSFSEFSSQSYQGIEWSQMKMNKLNSSTYSTIDWSEVQFGEFAKKQYKQTNWSQIDFEDFQAEDYNEVNWAQVKFKGSKAPNVDELDMSLVVEADSFSKKNAKQINWGQLSTDDLSSDALSKLESFNVKKKGVNVVDLLSPGTQSNPLSFVGVDGGGAAWTPAASPEASTGPVFPIAATDGSELMFV